MASPPGLAPGTSCFARKDANSYTSGTNWKRWRPMPVTLRLRRFDRPSCCYYNNGALAADRESHPALALFRRVLSCVSYTAIMVLPAGNAPASSAYQAGALLLSYGSNGKDGGRDRTRTCTPVEGLTVFKTAAGRPIILGLPFRWESWLAREVPPLEYPGNNRA